MEITTLEISGIASAVKALRLPFGKGSRSFVERHAECSHFDIVQNCAVHLNEDDIKLMSALVNRGDEHAKVVRGILAYAAITAPVYWWCEAETYRCGHERLSSTSTMHIDCKGLSGAELVKAKSEIPMGKELTKVDFFSYQALRNIVRQRHAHRLPEWHQFVSWVRTLPLADELIFTGLDIKIEE